MELTVIKEEQQYMEYLEWVDKKFDENVLPETTEGKQLEVALMKEMGLRN